MKDYSIILIIDDDKDVTELIEAYLSEQMNLKVLKAYNAQESLDILENHMPSIALIDAILPDKSGFEVAWYIKKKYPFCRCIMLTALDTSEDRRKAVQYGIDEFITKPIGLEELLGRIKSHLEKNEDISKILCLRNYCYDMIENLPDPIFLFRLDGKIEYGNLAFKKNYGEIKSINHLFPRPVPENLKKISNYSHLGRYCFFIDMDYYEVSLVPFYFENSLLCLIKKQKDQEEIWPFLRFYFTSDPHSIDDTTYRFLKLCEKYGFDFFDRKRIFTILQDLYFFRKTLSPTEIFCQAKINFKRVVFLAASNLFPSSIQGISECFCCLEKIDTLSYHKIASYLLLEYADFYKEMKEEKKIAIMIHRVS